MRYLLLAVLLGGLGYYIYLQRQANYPLQSLTLPSGKTYKAMKLQDDCRSDGCLHRLVYLTSLEDSARLQQEARGFLPWVETTMKGSRPPHSVAVLALEPGFLQIAEPKRLVVLTYQFTPMGSWDHVGFEDATPRIRAMLSGK